MKHYHSINSAKEQKLAEPDSSINQTQNPTVEWVQLSPDKTVFATTEKAYLLDRDAAKHASLPGYYLDNLTSSSNNAVALEDGERIAITKNLLDGAIAAAKYAVNSDARPPELTATRWIWRLAGSYHLCEPIPELMEEACRGFSINGHTCLAEWAAEKAKEEEGHDRLALRDIQSMGYDPYAVIKVLVPPAATALMNYFTRSVRDSDPIDCVGYSYTMERLALGIDEQYIQKVENLLAPDINATRCLRVHSSVGADAEHAEETVEMVAGLTAKERNRVAVACYETALMCFSPPQKYISDEEIQQIVESLKL